MIKNKMLKLIVINFVVCFATFMLVFSASADPIESFKVGQYVFTTAKIHYVTQNGDALKTVSYRTNERYISKIENGVVELIDIDKNGNHGKRVLQRIETLKSHFHSKVDADINTEIWNRKK